MRPRPTSPVLGLLLLVFLSASAMLAGASETTPTTTGSTTSSAQESAEEAPPEVASYADELGVSLETAETMLLTQSRLTTFADSIRRSLPGYAGFKVVRDGANVTGQLAVTPGTVVEIPSDLPIVVVEARVAESDVADFAAGVSDDLATAGVTDVLAVTYDPFEDAAIIWQEANAPRLSAAEMTALERAAVEILQDHYAGVEARVKRAPAAELTYGGLKETRPGGSLCSSGFGVTKYINGAWVNGYLTAGHCYLPNDTGWSILHPSGTMAVTSYLSALMGGYQDRAVFVATGASYWVKIDVYTTVDMQATAYHIYLGGRYCQWSPWANGGVGKQRCGDITEVNVPISQDGYTMFTSHTTATSCPTGSSGGPVWEYQPTPPGRKPVGMLEARNLVDGTCYYLALDDQLIGSGWSLL